MDIILKRSIDMMKCWKISVLLPYVGLLIMINAALAFAGNPGAVQNIHAVSGHEINRPSQETIIELVWSLPEGYTQESIEGYYYRFDTLSDEEIEPFDQENTAGMLLVKNQTAISTDYASLFPDDLYIFFHIAAIALDEEEEPVFGTTLTVGPFRIDITAPKNVWVSTLAETPTRNVILSLGAEQSNIEMYISNQAYGESGSGWIPFVSSKEWLLSDGEGEKSIYAEFRDDAGNIAKASTTIVYKTSDPITAQHSSNEYLPGSNVTLSNSISYTGTFSSIKYLIEIPQNWQMDSTSLGEDQYTVLSNGNIEYSWKNLESELGQLISFNCTLAVPYGETGDKSIQSLVSYQLENNTAMDEYAEPNPLIIAQKEQYYNMTVQYGENGSASVNHSIVSHGNSVEFQILPDEGYQIDQLTINGQPQSITGQYYRIEHATQDIQLITTFKRIEYDISVNIGENGTVQPGSQTVYYGDSVTFQIFPDRGYSVSEVLVNSESIQITNNILVLASIKKDQTISVSFEKIPETVTANHQTDPFFIPGQDVNISLDINYTGFLTALGFEIQLPEGFVYNSLNVITGQFPEISYNPLTQKLSFAWYKFETESISLTYKLNSSQDALGDFEVSGSLMYRFTDQQETEEPKVIQTTAVNVSGQHQNLTGPYVPGKTISVQNSVNYSGNFSHMALDVSIPDGWKYVGIAGETIPDIQPDSGAENNLKFQWTTIPDKISFIYEIEATNTFQDTVEIQSVVSYIHDDNGMTQSNLLPKQLLIEPAYIEATQTANKTYINGIPFLVNNQIDYNGLIEDLRLNVVIPESWVYTSVSGNSAPEKITPFENEIVFSWESIPQSPINFTYTLIPGPSSSAEKAISANVYYQRYLSEQSISVNPEVLTMNESSLLVTHSAKQCSSAGVACYTPGQQITISNEIIYSDEYKVGDNNSNELVSIGYGLHLPDGWQCINVLLNDTNYEFNTSTAEYDVEFYFLPIPYSPIQFTYTLQIPDTTTGMGKISAEALYRIGDDNEQRVEIAYPDPLVLYNIHPPTVNIQSSLTSPTNNNAIPITVTFSKQVSGFQASDILIENATISNFNGKGDVYTFIATSQEGEVSISIPQNCAIDTIGNGNMASTEFQIVVDQTQPTVTITSDIPEYANISPWPVTITFSEWIKDFEIDDIVKNNASIQDISTSEGTVFVINITPIDQGNVEIFIPAAKVHDMAGNNNILSNSYVRIYDSAPPNLTIIGSDTIRIKIGEIYEDQGAKATDNIDGDISNKIQVDNQIEQAVGEYKIVYTVSDRAGNGQTKERLVYVDPDQLTPTVQTEAGGYLPGNDYIVSVMIRFKTGCTAMGYELILPEGWEFDSVWGENPPDIFRFDNENILGFAWENVKFIESLSFSYAIRIPEGTTGNRSLIATVLYRYADMVEQQVNASFPVLEQNVIALHNCDSVYLPGKAVPINVDIRLSSDADTYNEFTAIGLIVNLPEGWAFDRAYGSNSPVPDITGIIPDQGATGMLQFAWFNIYDNNISFTYDIIPPLTADNSVQITGTVKYRFSNGIERSTQLLPEAIKLEPAELSIRHSCDPVYIPGAELPVNTIISYNGSPDSISDMILELSIPDEWSLTKVTGKGAPQEIIFQQNSILLKWTTPIPDDPVNFTYILIPNDNSSDPVVLSAKLTYNRFSEPIEISPETLELTKSYFKAQHTMLLPYAADYYFYTPGERIRINNVIQYSEEVQSSGLNYTITIPEGCSYADSSLTPVVNSNNQIVFKWDQTPLSPISFYYYIQTEPNLSEKIQLFGNVEYNNHVVPVYPNPIIAYDNLDLIPDLQRNFINNSATSISPMMITMIFTKPTTGLVKTDFLVKNAIINSLLKINGFKYQLSVTPIKEDDIIVKLLEGSMKDDMGKTNPQIDIVTTKYDVTPPTAEILSSVSSITNKEIIPIALKLSERVINFDESDILIENATIQNFIPSDINFTFDIVPSISESKVANIKISIAQGVLVDVAGNSNPITLSKTFIYDPVAPEISLEFETSQKTFATVQPISMTLKLSENIKEFKEDRIVIQNGILASFDPSTNKAIIQPEECGFVDIQVLENAAIDDAGNNSLATTPVRLTMNCTSYSGFVYENSINEGNELPGVNIKVVFPDNVEYPKTFTNDNGLFTLHLSRLESKQYYFSLEKKGYENTDSTNMFTIDNPESVTFTHKLKTQVMDVIVSENYGYTVSGQVTANGGEALTVYSENPTVKIFTVEESPQGITASTIASLDGSYQIYFKTKPESFTLVASMTDFYLEQFVSISENDSSTHKIVDLDMERVQMQEDEIIKSVSSSFGGTVKLQQSLTVSVAEIEVPPGTVNTAVKVEMKIEKNPVPVKVKLSSQVVDIKLADDVLPKENKFLYIQLKLSSEDITYNDFVNKTYYIFYAQTMEDFLKGAPNKIPVTDIIPSSTKGYIKFKVGHLTVFGVGQDISDDLPRLKDDISNTSQRRCFISSVQTRKMPTAAIVLIILTIVGIGITNRKKFFFNKQNYCDQVT